MNILVTGGAGYIGCHTVIELIEAGNNVVVIDNLSNSSMIALERVSRIVKKEIPFFKVDIRDREGLESVFNLYKFDCCIHFAGLKCISESIRNPWDYYDNNVCGTLILLDVLKNHGCKNIVFSSSASIYGIPENVPIEEEACKGKCTNPYGETKSMIEDILSDMYKSDIICNNGTHWNIVILRYFNPAGAHKSGLIGENPMGIPSNLMPYINQVAIGKLEKLTIYGGDYNTHDGTGVRDYIHVVDLAKGHLKALNSIKKKCGLKIYNLGTGEGYSVLDIVKAFKVINNVEVPYVIGKRREGDVAICYSNPHKAWIEMGWKAELSLEDMCRDSWNWQKKNPKGY